MTPEEMINALGSVRDQLVRNQVTVVEQPEHRTRMAEAGQVAGPTMRVIRSSEPPMVAHEKAVMSTVLYTLLVNLDGWIETARENHRASYHRGENTGEECWRQFTPADFRTMINDTARELGVAEFPIPAVAREDEVR